MTASKQAIRLVALTELEIEFLRRVCQDSDRDRAPRVFKAALDRDVTPHLPQSDPPPAKRGRP